MPAQESAARVLGRIEAQALRRCRVCGEERPATRDHFRTYAGKRALGTMCRACDVKRAAQWRAKNPEKTAEHRRARQRVLRERSRALKALEGKASPDEIDTLRRALAENPPGLTSEGERLAYFRGFLAACKRSKDEESRLLAFQDLVFRIASELAAKRRHWQETERFSYEEMVSIGYEAVLEVVRKKREPSRADVAGAIRYRIVDAARSEFGHRTKNPEKREFKRRLRRGQKVLVASDGEETPLVETLGDVDPEPHDGEALWLAIQKKARARFGPQSRFLDILHMRIKGHTFAEIGTVLELTESRVCQIFANEREWMERELAPLAAV